METDKIEPILLAFAEYTLPLRFVGRRISRLRESTVAHGAAHIYRTTIDEYPAAHNTYVTQTEGHTNGYTLIVYGTRIELRMELIPPHSVGT
jgi:hypothetical protein